MENPYGKIILKTERKLCFCSRTEEDTNPVSLPGMAKL